MIRRVKRWLVHLYRWSTDQTYREDINYRRWGVKTKDIPGSNCGLCGDWIEGDPGDPEYPPDWRWTMCRKCAHD